ncbi:hypothetical protein VTN31DRAFT_6599 [Thermomyces dupontii]|uniref:uncharacterized protein n=1 Tax=Talaromyces thermophilus TaxID=28565 RepID=UPI0037432B29
MGGLLEYILSHEESFRRNRLPSLYSDFAIQKTTNPDGYVVNVSSWEKALINAARKGQVVTSGDGTAGRKRDHLVLKVDENLLQELESPEWGKPVALGCVFDEAMQKRSMLPLQVYLSSASSLSASRWRMIDPSALSPWKVVEWGWRQLTGFLVGWEGSLSSTTLREQQLVLVDNLKDAANRVVQKALAEASSPLDRIYAREQFCEAFATVLDSSAELSDSDFDVLLVYLSRDSKAIAYDGQTIKFHTKDDQSPLSQQDKTIASLKILISRLTQQVARLERRVAELDADARSALQKKNRISALSALRSKKLAERAQQHRSDPLAQLEQVYLQIEQAADQVQIVRAMEASADVLRALRAQTGGIERVEDIVEELRAEMAQVDEVSAVLAGIGDTAGPSAIDEDEIDEELRALESAERRAAEEREEEATRKRLAELDALELERKAKEIERKEQHRADTQAIEEALSESMGKLSRVSLGDDHGSGDPQKDRRREKELTR